MEGSVYQRKDGRWVGVADNGKNINGTRKQKYVYGKTKKETQIKLNNLVYQLQNNIYRDAGNISFSSYIHEWFDISIPKWATTTAETNTLYLKKHIEKSGLANMKLKDIKPLHLDIFYNSLMSTVNEKKGLSANTVKKIHCLVRGSLEYAKKNQLILMNPADSIELPKTKKYEPRIYNEEQFIKLLEYVEGTPDEIPILLAGAVGLRRGEIFGLRWQDVDFNKCRLSIVETIVRIKGYTIKPPKTNESARIVSIPSYVMDILRNYKESLKILHIDDGERVVTAFKAGTYSEHFGNLFKKCGLPKIRLHDLRHYNAVIMMKYGIPDKVAASRLGHSNTQTLRKVYQHVLTDMDEVAADKINDMFAKNV